MDHNSNVNLQVVQGDFSIKYGPKTYNTRGQSLKKPCAILKLHFKSIMGINFLTFSNTDPNAPNLFLNSIYIALY